MKSQIESILFSQESILAPLASGSRDVVVVSTHFEREDNAVGLSDSQKPLAQDAARLLEESVRILKPDGLLFIYGSPRDLPSLGELVLQLREGTAQMVFRNWIALDIDDAPRTGYLKPTHVGLLMFAKASAAAKFRVNMASVRIPHLDCAACGRTLKDWGGKKHWMNPRGAALSDVWRDLPRRRIRNCAIPEHVLRRIAAMTAHEGVRRLHVIQAPPSRPPRCTITRVSRNHFYQGDCVSFLNRVAELHPNGLFDLAFADPPYNLEKRYDTYADTLAERHYLEWCERWLDGMARTLKPGGSLFVLNLPRWAMHHAAFLNARLEFRHWIVWDALSEPRGRLMPAHYALLYYTKPGGKPVFNYAGVGAKPDPEVVQPPDAPKYCLRAACIRDRKAARDDDRVELSDVWFDVHRIKHKRDRDAHPCQLPEKLMERIIRLVTRPGDLVFDPFCGAGTSAIAAAKLGRDYVMVDLDSNYVRISKTKLAAMKQAAEATGTAAVPRQSVLRPRKGASKRTIELALQNLARGLGRMPTEADLSPELLKQIALIYPYPGAALKRAKVVLPA